MTYYSSSYEIKPCGHNVLALLVRVNLFTKHLFEQDGGLLFLHAYWLRGFQQIHCILFCHFGFRLVISALNTKKVFEMVIICFRDEKFRHLPLVTPIILVVLKDRARLSCFENSNVLM